MTSSARRLVSVRFSESDYTRLEKEAAALGLKPAVLARVMVRAGLNAPREATRPHSRKQFAEAMARLDRLAAHGRAMSADPVGLTRRAREERENQRASALSPPSAGR
jgi:hypothetical protein